MPAALHLKSGVRHRIQQGHPWVFRSEIGRIDGQPEDGDSVEIFSERGRLLGSAFYNSRSQITARRYSTKAESFDRAFIEKTLTRAFAYRADLFQHEPQRAYACRLAWSEADDLPGLILDRYGDVLVVQALTSGIARHQALIVEIALEKTTLSTVIARNDAPVRQLEGLPLEKKVLRGNYVAPTTLAWGDLEFSLDLMTGQKTGFYLDQLDNYAIVARHAAGRRVLDCFSNQGAFALLCRKHGAISCLALDQSTEALQRGRETAERAGLAIDWVEANAFDWLRQAEREKRVFDLIILDPPSFTKRKDQVEAALRGYHELHVRASQMLAPHGLLATFTCSHSMTDEIWRKMLQDVADDVGLRWRLIAPLTQSRDHPVLMSVPETEYLRGFLLEKI